MGSISELLGYVLNFIYGIVHNYGWAIIIFSVLLKLILLPLSIKQQKTMKKTAKVQEKVKEIQDKYKNDPNKMQQEMMDLYKRENMSPFSGCLSAIIQIVLLLAVFGLVRNPLTNMLKIDENIVNKVQEKVSQEYKVDGSYPQISTLKYVIENKDENKTIEIKLSEEETKTINLEDLYINMEFLGLDLSNVPKDNLNDYKTLIIPVLYVLTSMLSMKISTAINKSKKSLDENKENSDKEELDTAEMTQQMNKSMTWFMPIMSVSISMVAPLGLALYWLVNNILMIIERLVLNKLINSEEEEQNG